MPEREDVAEISASQQYDDWSAHRDVAANTVIGVDSEAVPVTVPADQSSFVLVRRVRNRYSDPQGRAVTSKPRKTIFWLCRRAAFLIFGAVGRRPVGARTDAAG